MAMAAAMTAPFFFQYEHNNQADDHQSKNKPNPARNDDGVGRRVVHTIKE
jgi:hypothetical protein